MSEQEYGEPLHLSELAGDIIAYDVNGNGVFKMVGINHKDHQKASAIIDRVNACAGMEDDMVKDLQSILIVSGGELVKSRTELADATAWLEKLDTIFHHPTDCVDGLMAGDLRDFLAKRKEGQGHV